MKSDKKIMGRDADTVEGAGHRAMGKAKEALGNPTGNTETKAEGKTEQVRGAVQESIGKTKDAIRGVRKGMQNDAADRKR